MRYFDLTVPEAGVPVLVEVPHAGLSLPDAVSDEVSAPHEALLRDADLFVDKLYQNAPSFGASLLSARVSRYVVDLNRAQDDVDAATVSDHPAPVGPQPRGVVWRATTDGRPILARPLTYDRLLKRLSRFYIPYHQALESTLHQLRERFGHVVLVAGHSMPSRGRAMHSDSGSRRADVVPGTRGRTSADGRVIDLVDAHFRAAGLSVRHDDPYRGGYTTGHYGRPDQGIHAIQIELSRALYVDEATSRPLEDGFAKLQTILDELIPKLGALKLP